MSKGTFSVVKAQTVLKFYISFYISYAHVMLAVKAMHRLICIKVNKLFVKSEDFEETD